MPSGQRARKKTSHRTKPDRLAKEVGVRVRRLRQEQDFSFDAFVEEVGLGRGYVSEIQRGMVVPTLTALAKLAKALGVTVADLVLRDSPRERIFELTRSLDAEDLKRVVDFVERAVAAQESKAAGAPKPV
jgi:transcriptional regulator with XRE-family HTH domain